MELLLASIRLFQGTLKYREEQTGFCEVLPFVLPKAQHVYEAIASYDCYRSRWWHALVSQPLGLFYSSNGARICTRDWKKEHRAFIESLYESVLHKLNRWEGKPCQLFPIASDYFARIYALKYDGNSHFGWHYDSVSASEYRVIFTVKSSETLHLWVRRPEGPQVMKMQNAEGLIMQSAKTFHGVFGDNKPASRWVIIFTYTSIEKDTRQKVGAADFLLRRG